MSDTKPSARAGETSKQPEPEQKLIDKRTTFLLVPNSEVEDRICRAYLEAKYGDNLKALIVSAIPVQRLTDQHAVIVVARKKTKPITVRQQGPDGMPQDYPIPMETVIQDVTERGPLMVEKFWLPDAELGGVVDQTALIVALNQIAQPFCVRFRADEGLIRLFNF
jgi:hypothetical protein